MSDLIPIISRSVGDSVNAVDGRTLHAKLGAGRDFSTWVKSRIAELGLVEDIDFATFPRSPDSGNAETSGFRTAIEYALTLDAAKHIALAERTEKGREIRAYFIEAEKKLRAIAPAAPNLRDPMTAVALLADALTVLSEEREAKEAAQASLAIAEVKIATDAPKVIVHDRLMDLDGTSGFREAAQAVRAATGANENMFRGLMRSQGWIQRLDGRLAPMVKGMAHGFVTRRMTAHMRADGSEHTVVDLRITPKGIARAIELLLVENEAE